jgi:hypothetical protein
MEEGAVVLTIGAAIAGGVSLLVAAVIFFSIRNRA